jgi:hypothetical protein
VESDAFSSCDKNVDVDLSLLSPLVKRVNLAQFNIQHFLRADLPSEATRDLYQAIAHQKTYLKKTPTGAYDDAKRCETYAYC